jgi:hypothetical protein
MIALNLHIEVSTRLRGEYPGLRLTAVSLETADEWGGTMTVAAG